MSARSTLSTVTLKVLLAGAVWLLPPAHVAGAGVHVLPEAARSGSYGLRVDVQEACTGDETVLVVETVTGAKTVEACQEVIAVSEIAAGGALTAVGGRRVVFGDGFRVASGGRLAAGSGGRAPDAVVEVAPAGEPVLFVRAFARFDRAGLAAGEAASLLALDGARGELATVRLEGTSTGRAVRLEVVDEAGVRVRSAAVPVGAGWHGLEVRWDVGAAVTASGEAELFVDGSSRALLSGLATGQSLVDSVRVGAWNGSRNAGWIDFDEVAAARTGPIGSGGP